MINISVFAQKKIAITIDDPTTKLTPKMNWKERDNMILRTLEKYKIKAALFVCAMRLDHPDGLQLLNNWDSLNHLICNHTYSHIYYHSSSVSSAEFISDFIRGDSFVRNYKNFSKLFRFPYLKEGNTVEKRDEMRLVLEKYGYKNGHVTIDASDWFIDAEITTALIKNPEVDLTPYKEYYIKHILDRFNYYDSLAHLVFNREVKHTLLIHHSLLNALFLDELLSTLILNGWTLINADEAFNDEIFLESPNFLPCGESIIWQCAYQIDEISHTLRYPGEDGIYEKIPLAEHFQSYEFNENSK